MGILSTFEFSNYVLWSVGIKDKPQAMRHKNADEFETFNLRPKKNSKRGALFEQVTLKWLTT